MRKILIIGLILMLCAVTAPVAAADFGILNFPGASDAGIVPIIADNNDLNSCEDLGLDSTGYCYSEEITGTCSNPDGFSATFDASDLDDITWSANSFVDAVVVKDGALLANGYLYHPNELMSDGGLWATKNAAGGGSLSHIFLCYSSTPVPEFPVVALPVGLII
ncbi:MAG TPA: hypothetical protein VLL74_02330, partial [Methanoregula sp.]|nr:hypothetical protein [Methanoregula sp.]